MKDRKIDRHRGGKTIRLNKEVLAELEKRRLGRSYNEVIRKLLNPSILGRLRRLF